ncbi:unknown protein [Xanthomonas oryzae pv. oryzae KACC 10331]|uniref:Uncharacterized protein n=1 Tax=Xanthomonas oryzae pv. oryzae (strain KACC10331 / KXO85) TaxID=291331 RepID=Q5H607_XANOR|nr:unknown protein [Xanthomonas oryzae pv. oryzae KACC 10331]
MQRILDQVVLEHLLGQQLLQSRVLGLQVLEPLGIGHAHAAELAAPQVVRGLTEAMPSAQVLDRHAGLGFAQEADDLLFGKTLLHVQSPRGRELDSKRRCYSKSGGTSPPHVDHAAIPRKLRRRVQYVQGEALPKHWR